MTSPTEATPPWCPRLLTEFDAADARASDLVNTLTPQQLNWKPTPGAWSVGQCLEHLCITSDVYLPPMASAIEGRARAVVQDIAPGWFGRWFIRNYIEPSATTKKAPAPKQIAPGSSVDAAVLNRFLSGNQSARELVRRAAGYDVNKIRFKNPFIPLIWFTVGTGLEIISKHQRRHLLQAERVRKSAGFPERESGR